MKRCEWVTEDPLYLDYHDHQWGVPLHDDRELFEMLILEGAQAGLSWITVLKKRAHYKKVFHDFQVAKVAKMTDQQLEKLLLDPGIIRNRLKVYGTRKNALATLRLIQETGTLENYLWSWVDHKPIINKFKKHTEIPNSTPISEKISKDLKKRGFTFVGPTIIYAYIQAIGMVNDHTIDCDFHQNCC
ncbi:MAG: DNA-3-methyladenine glycosylase I [Rubritalea sp.]|jgi:DNA-3-methyladenine glycosylase I